LFGKTLEELPRETVYEELASMERVFKNEDPSLYYEMIEPIGNGASSKIFRVRRLLDDKLYAIKFMGAEDEFEK